MKTILLISLVVGLSLFLLFFGESGLSHNFELIWELRLPKVLACVFAGGTLAIAGLLMQVFFQNPLAGPDILGISSGSSLFVAFGMMAAPGLTHSYIDWKLGAMSFMGALLVFLILSFFLHKNMSKVSLIIVGLLISSFASSGISILVNMSQALELKNYLTWSMGSFRNINSLEIPRFLFFSFLSILPVIFFLKSFNQFLLSENYAKSMGINVKKLKFIFISLAAFQVSIVTLYCGPVGFIGVIAPHLAKQILRRAQLNALFPAVFCIGALLALIAETVLVFTPTFSISVNAILGLIGAPVIVVYLYRQRGVVQ